MHNKTPANYNTIDYIFRAAHPFKDGFIGCSPTQEVEGNYCKRSQPHEMLTLKTTVDRTDLLLLRQERSHSLHIMPSMLLSAVFQSFLPSSVPHM